MLHSLTGIDINDLVGAKINSPENRIYMNHTDHLKFRSFLFYFDKDEVRIYRIAAYESETIPSTQISPTSTKYGWPDQTSC